MKDILSQPTSNSFPEEILTIFLYNLSKSFVCKEGTILHRVALHLAFLLKDMLQCFPYSNAYSYIYCILYNKLIVWKMKKTYKTLYIFYCMHVLFVLNTSLLWSVADFQFFLFTHYVYSVNFVHTSLRSSIKIFIEFIPSMILLQIQFLQFQKHEYCNLWQHRWILSVSC